MKDDAVHLSCWDPELDKEFKADWNTEAFRHGIINISESVNKPEQNNKNKIYAYINWEMSEREVNLLCDTYSFKKETIKQIKGNKFLLELQNQEAYDKIVKLDTIQLGTEPIRISQPGRKPFRIIQCFTCQQYGHFSRFCPTGIFICRLCARTHEPERCPEYLSPNNWRCINCKNEPESNHKAGSYNCPAHQAEMQRNSNRMQESSFQGSGKRKEALCMEELKTVLDDYTDKITSFAKCMYYDSTITYKNINEIGREIFNKELNQVKEIIDPVDNEDERGEKDEDEEEKDANINPMQ